MTHGVEPREGRDQGLGLALIAPETGYEDRVGRGVLRHRGQYGVGADLQEHGSAGGGECTNTVTEADGLTDVPYPVLGGAEIVRSRQL
ncbi:hypothetical protein ACIBM4_35990, partial [Streptomyces sp. NPDC050256]|uniref:hypothetical protein n=1 Tax=Streptomyces sp. NPDC050256 TaxID=3365607 RepID=UPI0037B17198